MSDPKGPSEVPDDERVVEAADELLAGQGDASTREQEAAPGDADRIAPGQAGAGLEHLR